MKLALLGYSACLSCAFMAKFEGHELFAAFAAALVTVGWGLARWADRNTPRDESELREE